MSNLTATEIQDRGHKTKIGFVGLGIMGEPMARNLVRAGFEVVGYNRSPAGLVSLVAAGGRRAEQINQVAVDADFVITMLPDSGTVMDVALGKDGILERMAPGSIFIDMSTVHPSTSREIEAAAKRIGVSALDAPVSGGQQGAIDVALSIMVGGDPDSFERAQPVLSSLGSTIVHVGAPGSGQTVKAANQMIVAGTIALVSEALIFLGVCGVNTNAAVQVLANGLAGNRILDRKAASMLSREFAPGFRIDLHHKDLGIALAAAREVDVALPVSALVTQLMTAARAQGFGGLDHSALLLTLESLSGIVK